VQVGGKWLHPHSPPPPPPPPLSAQDSGVPQFGGDEEISKGTGNLFKTD